MTPRKYIEKMCATFEQLFGHPPKQVVTSPIQKNDHPELDTSELLGLDDITKYQSLIGALQWAVSIGRFDIMTDFHHDTVLFLCRTTPWSYGVSDKSTRLLK